MSSRAYAQYTISDINDGVGILKIEEQYCKSIYDNIEDLESHNPEWLDYQPVWENGYYIWTRSKITWDSDDKVPNPSYTDPVLATTFQTLYSDIVNQVIPNIAVKDSNGKWSLVSGVLQNTYLYTDEERNVPVYLSTLGSAITTTANGIRQEVSNNYISSDKLKGSYVVCNTQANVFAKTALCSDQEIIDGFELYDGMAVNCVFSNGNTAYNSSTPITLSVNGTTAYPIRDFDGTILTEEESKLYAGAMVTFIYDDTAKCWKMQNTGTVAKISSNSTLIEQTSRNILIQATNGTNVTNTDVGNSLISFINVAPDGAQISSEFVDIEGAAIFSSYTKTNDLPQKMHDLGYITSSAVSETYATKSNAIVETQRIYMQTSTNQQPSTPGTTSSDWVISTSDVTKWTTQRRSYNPAYPYLWTCEQRKTAEGTLAYTPVLIDDTTTVIDGGKIIAHSITSSAISTDLIKSNNYSPPTGDENSGTGTYPYSVSGTYLNLSNGDITSPNFVVKGTDAYLRGTIETRKGHIGGFVITENSIYHNKRDVTSVDLSDDVFIISSDPYVLDQEDYLYGGYATLYEVYMGVDGISCGFGKFAVDSSGELFASNATIRGTINATSGKFGISGDYYDISTNGLIGYTSEYYYRMLKLSSNYDYIKLNGITVKTSSNEIVTTYSYSDIQAMNHFVSIGFTYDENNNTYATLYVDEDIPLSSLFEGTITQVNCNYTYDNNGETTSGSQGLVNPTISGGVTTPLVNNIRTGTELGYDYLKTGKLIASDGLIIVDDNNQNAISITRSSVIVGNSLDDSGSSYIYIDNNDFNVFDSRHAKAFSVSSDGALLIDKKRIEKGLNISSYSASSSSPTTQTVTIDCVARNLPTGSNSDAKITFEIVGKHVNDDSFAFWDTGLEVSLENIKNAGSSGLDFHTSYYDDGWRIVFVYNNQSQTISVTTNITSEGQKWFKQIFATLRTYSYVETTESMTPYFSMGSRKENTTLGAYSISGGYDIEASGNYSQAFGCGTIAQGAFQTVIGKYNLPVGTNDSVSNSVSNTDFAFMIGNGTSDNARTNAFAVDWNGTAHLRSIRSIRHSYVGPCPDGDAYEEILVGNMTSRAGKDEPVDIAAWIRCTIIALCEDYPGKVKAIFKGRIVPNSDAYFEICIYDTSTTERAYDYLPQYAYGVYRQWPSAYWIVWVDNYEFHYKAL